MSTTTTKPAPRSSPGDESVDDYSVDLNPVPSFEDNESIALLRQIFPEESTDALRRLHRRRMRQRNSNNNKSMSGDLSTNNDDDDDDDDDLYDLTPALSQDSVSPLRRRNLPFHQQQQQQQHRNNHHYSLPDDFLRLPSDVAVRRYDASQDRFRYELVADLDRRLKEKLFLGANDSLQQQQQQHHNFSAVHTRVIFRHAKVGLGLTLVEQNGQVRVYATLDYQGKEWNWKSPSTKVFGPAMDAGLEPGDIVLGLNGTLFTESSNRIDRSLLRDAVETIRTAPDPVVIHFAKNNSTEMPSARTPGTKTSSFASPLPQQLIYNPATTPSLLDTTLHDLSIDESRSQEEISFSPVNFHSTPHHGEAVVEPRAHKFLRSLHEAGLFTNKSAKEIAQVEELYSQFTERTRQWEALSCFRVHSKPDQDLFVPLMGIRKALCVRIVHSFATAATASKLSESNPLAARRQQYTNNDDMVAYTIWVYDTESGREFYAPVRTLSDFSDLRASVVALQSDLRNIDFPKRKSLFGSPVRESASVMERRTRQLEHFLRVLCAILYQGTLHESIAEIIIHVQSFLGCDNVNFTAITAKADDNDFDKHTTRARLKRSLQMYTYRLFLLPPLAEKVANFVDHVRGRRAAAKDMEAMEAQGSDRLKDQAFGDLGQVKAFLDYLQDLILDGCMDDFVSIARREEYDAIHAIWHGSQGEVIWDRLVREAVREQVEIEVYVPLRSVLSQWLVNGWRHEDMEAHYKIKELRKRPQQFFRLPSSHSVDDWMTASNILKEGVGMSTLPCVKLRAIVDAAQEISRIFETKRTAATAVDDGATASSVAGHLGADLFLPIFIFCVVQAEIDRPCALCVLLRSLCDRINKIGEIGYYLASFEAAVTHIQEIDLAAEQGDLMRSFLSVNLDSN